MSLPASDSDIIYEVSSVKGNAWDCKIRGRKVAPLEWCEICTLPVCLSTCLLRQSDDHTKTQTKSALLYPPCIENVLYQSAKPRFECEPGLLWCLWRRTRGSNNGGLSSTWQAQWNVQKTKQLFLGSQNLSRMVSLRHSYLGPRHTRAKSRDHGIVRAQKKVPKGHPNAPPNSCSVKSYVTGPSTKCYFNELLFMRVLTYDIVIPIKYQNWNSIFYTFVNNWVGFSILAIDIEFW